MRIVGGLEALPEAGAEHAVVDGAADLKEPVGPAPGPAHLLRLGHAPVDPGNWPCPRSVTSRPAGRPGAVRRSRPDGRSGSAGSGPPRPAPAAACERARPRKRAGVSECARG